MSAATGVIWSKLRTLNDIGGLDALMFIVAMGGNIYYVDGTNGDDSRDGTSIATAVKTLTQGYSLLRSGKHDAIVLVSDPTSTNACTVRVDASFNWNKPATHLFGQSAPVLFSQRARLAPTATTTAFASFFTVSASGCMFFNVQFFQGFNTGVAAEICMNVTGSRNYFKNCHFAGMGDTASATDTGSRSLKIGSAGSGENVFEDCVIGIDTVARTVANASLELAGATARNVFRRCIFPFLATNAGVLGILGTGANCIDRINIFDDCLFANALKSTGITMTQIISFTVANPGGLIVLKKCMLVATTTKWGDTNGLANTFIDMPATSQASGGIGNVPS